MPWKPPGPATEQLEVAISDPSFRADIQSNEGLALSQYGSLLKEHERAPFVLGLLQIIVNYIQRAQTKLWDPTDVGPVKATFRLMHRTEFSSMFGLLNPDEKVLFNQIVQSDAIPKELGVGARDPLFKTGYWGHYAGMMALFRGGKVVALATED